ncbi:MAG: flagellar biosynthesis anti-sigma factor FlgM [Burkholderiales bacterium]|nr:flagellar biosynthesis anti-sigma factor FlgM [Burkholderiales bacterium]OJX09116.1 MAG: flagellar biosynthesis anti-sigma factor FlgM [Burkholderiales bacterium 70-64]
MKIGKPADIQQTDASLRQSNSTAAATARSGGSGTVEKATDADAVRLSQTSKALTADGTPVNAAKVEEVKTALREGRFHVNVHAVADKMISQAAELLETLSRQQK